MYQKEDMLMNCKKCKKEIPDESIYCMWCGAKQKRDPPKNKKRANGTGSVFKLPGRRRKPWAAAVVKNGKRIYLGYYETRVEAIQNVGKTDPDTVSDRYGQTIQEIYDDWKVLHFTGLTDSGEQGYKTAWTYFDEIKTIKMRDAKTDTFQSCINNATDKGKSRSVCEKIKQLSSQLCKFAMQQDIINKNYAQFLVLPREEKKEKDIFTDDEIAFLFKHDYDNRIKIILTLIYTGFRIDELFSLETDNVHIKENYVVGGLKTEAGKDRTVPINSKIKKYVEAWYNAASKNGTKYLITNSNGNKKDVKNFRSREFYPALQRLKILPELPEGKTFGKEFPARLTPHSCRHTFASLMARANVKPEVLQAIIGHADYSTTAEVYIHENMDELQKGIQKI